MTSKLKCPYCSADLESTTGGWEYGCTNTECQSAGTLCGTEELWQALIQSEKKLDIAIERLNRLAECACQGGEQAVKLWVSVTAAAGLTEIEQIEHKEK